MRRTSKTKCIECSAEIISESRYCTVCGAKQSTEIKIDVQPRKKESKIAKPSTSSFGLWSTLRFDHVVWGIREKPRFIVWVTMMLLGIFLITIDSPLSPLPSPSLLDNLLTTFLIGIIPYLYLKRLFNNSLKDISLSESEIVLEEDDIKLNIIWGIRNSRLLTGFSFLWILFFFYFPVLVGGFNSAYELLGASLIYVTLFGFPILWVLGYKRKRNRNKTMKMINEKQIKIKNLHDNAFAIVNSKIQLDISDIAKEYNLDENEVIEFFKEKIEKDGFKIRISDEGKIISDYIIKKKIKEILF
jgi:hypothetical protein